MKKQSPYPTPEQQAEALVRAELHNVARAKRIVAEAERRHAMALDALHAIGRDVDAAIQNAKDAHTRLYEANSEYYDLVVG